MVCPFSINLPVSLCSAGITPFQSSYGHSDSRRGEGRMRAWPYGGGCSRITSSADPRRVSLLTLLDLPTIPPPTTPRCSRADLSLLSGLAIRTLCHPVCRDHGSRASPVPSRLATTTGRIEFVILRTGSSLSVALHLLSQGRSYLQLRGPDQPLQGLPPRRSNSITGALGRRSPSSSGSLWHDGPRR